VWYRLLYFHPYKMDGSCIVWIRNMLYYWNWPTNKVVYQMLDIVFTRGDSFSMQVFVKICPRGVTGKNRTSNVRYKIESNIFIVDKFGKMTYIL
jgi:hypothetical protein